MSSTGAELRNKYQNKPRGRDSINDCIEILDELEDPNGSNQIDVETARGYLTALTNPK